MSSPSLGRRCFTAKKPASRRSSSRWSPSRCWLFQSNQVRCAWEVQRVQLPVARSSCDPSCGLSSCSVWTSHLPFLGPPGQAVLQHHEQAGVLLAVPLLQRAQLWGKLAACYRESAVLRAARRGLGVDLTGCLCCVSACTSSQSCLEVPWARLAATPAVKSLSLCYRIHGHGSYKMFVPVRTFWVLLSVLGPALCSPVLL